MIDYGPFWDTLNNKGVTAYALTNKYGINNATLTRMRNNKHISTRTIDDLCIILNCDVCDIIKHIKQKDE